MGNTPVTVGELRKLIEGVPDDVILLRPGRGDIPITFVKLGEAYYNASIPYPEWSWYEASRLDRKAWDEKYGPAKVVLLVH